MKNLAAHVARQRLETVQRANDTRVHLEAALALAATMLLAGLWAGAPYLGRSFFLMLLSWTVGIPGAAIAYAIATKRLGLLIYSPVFFVAAFGKELFAALFFLGAILGFPVAALVAVINRKRTAWLLAGQAVLIAATAFGATKSYFHSRDWGARHAADRGNQIVEAINRYQASEGKLPDTLKDLVPRELEWVPNTGMIGYRSFHYFGPVDEAVAKDEQRLFATYEIRVNLYKFLQFDSLVYWPEGNYPDFMYSGWVERIGDWAYVHE